MEESATPSARTAADAMVRRPKVSPADITVADARRVLADDHVHAVLAVRDDRLLAVVERPDLDGVPSDALAAGVGRLEGRTVDPGADLATLHRDLLDRGVRRLAVVDGFGTLLGLLCLKQSGDGFCSDADVAGRAAERAAFSRIRRGA